MTGTGLVHSPSGAAADTVYLSGGRAWLLRSISSVPLPLDVGAGQVIGLLGNPERSEAVAVVRQDDQSELRHLDLVTGTVRVVYQHTHLLSLLGWITSNTVVVGIDDGETPLPVELSLHSTDTPPGPRPSDVGITHLTSIDHTADGLVVGTTGAIHPSTWRGYRGGARGRIQILDGGRSRFLPLRDNGAHAVVVDERIYFLGDDQGPVDVYSLPIDGTGQPRRHTHFAEPGAVSLRRGLRHLIVGTPGEAWSLDPRGDELHRLTAPGRIRLPREPDPPQPVERAVFDLDRARLAIRGAGLLTVVDVHSGSEWTLPHGYGWVLDADWSPAGRLIVLVRSRDVVSVLQVDPESSIIGAVSVPEADLTSMETAVALDAGVVISSETGGVVVVDESGALRWIVRGWSYRRSRPCASPDGRHLAWTEAAGHQGGTLHVADLRTGQVAVLAAAGQDISAPVFDRNGYLLFLSRMVSPTAGTASPLVPGSVVGRMTGDDSLLDSVQECRTQAVHRDPGVLLGLAVHDGLWVRSSAGWRSIDGPGPFELKGIPVGDGRSPVVKDFGADGELLRLPGGEHSLTLPSPRVRPHDAHTTLQELLHLLHTQGMVEMPDDVERLILTLAPSARDSSDLRALATAAVRQIGRSHASIFRQQDLPQHRSLHTFVSRILDHARDRVGPGLAYVSLPDVSVKGLRALERLCRTWTGDGGLVMDLRYNSGGPFADHLHALFSNLLDRKTSAISPAGHEIELLTGPSRVHVLVNEYTGSGGGASGRPPLRPSEGRGLGAPDHRSGNGFPPDLGSGSGPRSCPAALSAWRDRRAEPPRESRARAAPPSGGEPYGGGEPGSKAVVGGSHIRPRLVQRAFQPSAAVRAAFRRGGIMNTTVLQAKDLQKFYGPQKNSFHALKGVSLEIEEGESLAIVGRSGSGKSTLLQLLGLLDTADSGDLLVDGRPVSDMTIRETDRLRNGVFGFVFQQFHLDETASLFENVSLPLVISGVPRSECRSRVQEVLARLGIAERSGDPVGQLSGGQRQRVAIARALVNRPRVLFADEPTGALDVENSQSVADLLFGLNQKDGITLVIVTHSDELTAHCDRKLTIVDGSLVEHEMAAAGGIR